MRILLLQPNYDVHVVHPPLGLGYLASYLEKGGHTVSIFDGTLKNADLEDYLQEISRFSPDLVGISVLSRGHNKAKTIVKTIKKRFKNLPVVIGGTQVTAAPKEVLADLGADFAVVGEGEITLFELVGALEKKEKPAQVDGLAFWKGKSIILTRPRELIKNLDSLPFPAWHLMPPSAYRIAPILEPVKASPVGPIFTSRGCPYDCSFCASNATWQRKLRLRSLRNIIEEIKMLKEEYGVKEIHISDDNFTADTKRAEKICDALIKEKINLPWQCPSGVRIDRLPLPLLTKMKKSGCYAVGLGIESGNQEILKRANKKLDLKVVPKVLENLRRVGIESYGFFILGLPGETRETLQETVDFALKNQFDRVWFNLFTPYPGSLAFKDWIGNRKLAEIEWDKHDCSTALISENNLSLQEIEHWQRRALRNFYLKPINFYKLISRLGPREIGSLFMSRFFRKFSGTL